MSGIPEEAKLESAPDAKAPSLTSQEKKKIRDKKHGEKYRKENKEKIAMWKKEYRKRNKEKILLYRKKYDEEHADHNRERTRKYVEKHKEKMIAYYREYRKKNREKVKNLARKNWEKNKEKLTKINMLWAKNHPERCGDYRRKRRAVKTGVGSERFRHIDIYNRDGWICGICHKRVDRKLKYPDQMSASLDHIIPLACGGTHAKNNVQLAHWICNVRANTGGIKQLLIPLQMEETL